MVASSFQTELLTVLNGMPSSKQYQVLDFARFLRSSQSALPPGTPGVDLLRFAGRWTEEEGKAIEQAIEEEFERIDPREW